MEKESTIKLVLRWVLAIAMIAVGIEHFRNPAFFENIMPDYLPWHLELVYISGVFEILGGVGLLVPMTKKAAAWGLVALYICVFPANINHAVNNVPMLDGRELHPALLWGRLPLQAVIILWAWWYTRSPQVVDNEDQ
ncbi:MAG: DoxX family protein [Planctomycetota bacterium]|nr:DoxX family protein [Planctomycetota bacterium]